MKKSLLKLAFIAILGTFIGYNAYKYERNNSQLSNIMLDNIKALASESSSNECFGCKFTSFSLICKTFGDWGACLGEKDYYI